MEDYAWFGLGRSLERQRADGQAVACFRMAAAMRPSAGYADALTRAEEKAASGETGDSARTRRG